jgi:general secretion pathway protein A
MDFSAYWGLSDQPFEELCNTRYFFESDDHREALDRMMYIVNDRNMNMGLLTGEVGSGKTITKNVLQKTLDSSQFEVICFENSNFLFNDLLYDIIKRINTNNARAAISSGLDLPERSDKYGLVQALKDRLDILIYEEKRHLVLLFDEAQQIEDSVLDEIKNLTNISSETRSYMTIFLVGQPELRENIRRLPQVDQRIFLRFHLNNLDFNNSSQYIQHRLRVAGHRGTALFDRPAQELIFRSTAGIPREINRVCKLALTHGFANSLSVITQQEIELILQDIEEHRA